MLEMGLEEEKIFSKLQSEACSFLERRDREEDRQKKELENFFEKSEAKRQGRIMRLSRQRCNVKVFYKNELA